ncbi:hypothetical protein B0T14DRAFT_519714 [Immersiella caudata]|uniref:Uncharacterized protein n=1 Tax=Immersiella caudata TaxID=314043 RepID=A0AA39WQG1_9PEZI|nr:hypothetical protein B0T14DRAFT_519714 [Immersiella caudata]
MSSLFNRISNQTFITMSSSESLIGTAPPPPGVTANFATPDSMASRLIATAAIWPAVVVPIDFLRLYTSSLIVRKWHRDDTFIIIALVRTWCPPTLTQLSPPTPASCSLCPIPSSVDCVCALDHAQKTSEPANVNHAETRSGVGRHIWDVPTTDLAHFM